MNSNDEISLVKSLEGFLALHEDLSHVKNHGILMRNDEKFKRDSKSVILISGGGSGHEPFPIGFVGSGMLSLAVCGQIFTSPSVTSCLASILLAASSDPNREILMIINNYTGDRLNFGLAIETARNVHKIRNVKTLIVNDDAAIENPRPTTGKRGLTGINLIIKIAGAMSARGFSLNEIHERCSSLLRDIRTIGFSFHHNHQRNQLTDVEIGYGIHGEPGVMKVDRAYSFKPVVDVMMKKFKLNEIKSNGGVVLLFNNLGGASEFAFAHFIREFIDEFPLTVLRVYAGKFLTSLGKEGIGVTLMEATEPQLLEFLDDPIDVPAKSLYKYLEISENLRTINFNIPAHHQRREEEFKANVKECEIEMTKKVLKGVCEKIKDLRECLNTFDSELGDSDTGSTLWRGVEGILEQFETLRFDNPHALLAMLSDILMRSMGGTSGAIFSIFFQCASNAFTKSNENSINNWIRALTQGIEGIKEHGKAEIGDRTLLDALNAGLEEIKSESYDQVLKQFASGCERGAEATETMKPKSGRASYSLSDNVNDTQFNSDYPDPGAYAVSVIAKTIFEICSDK